MNMKRKSSLQASNQKWALFFCAPNILFFLIFFVTPAIIGFSYSLTNYNGWKQMDFLGLKNYLSLLSDPEFITVFLNTIKYTLVTVPIGYAVALGLAILLSDEKIVGNTITRVLVYWPTLLSTIMVGLTWKWIFGENFGVINYLLSVAKMKPILWSSGSGPAFWTTVIASTWSGCGINLLIFIGGIKQIPESLHEAATIDGANKWQDFWNVTLPSLRPVSFMVITLSIINSFKAFAMVQTLTNGGPGTATTYMIQYIYMTGFNKMKVGYSCAASIIMFFMLMIVSIIQTKMDEKLRN